MNKQMNKNEKGFTLIELIIVIAVMGIIAAVLVPSFTQMTAKAKVSTDIRSIQMVQSQLDLYRAEHNNQNPVAETAPNTQDVVEKVVQGLVDKGYITGKIKGTSKGQILSKEIGLQSDIVIVWQTTNEPTSEHEKTLAIQATVKGSATDKILNNLADGSDAKWIVKKQ